MATSLISAARMHILCVDQFETIGGAQRCLLDLLPDFDARGCSIEVVVPAPGPFSRHIAECGAKISYSGAAALSSKHKPLWEIPRYWRNCIKTERSLKLAVGKRRPDLLYINGPRYLPCAAKLAIRESIPVLFHAHNRLLQQRALHAVGASLKNSRAQVLACCRYVAESLAPYVAQGRMNVVYNGTRDFGRARRPHSADSITIGVIGRIAPEKGQLELIHALKLLGPEARSVRVLLIGSAAHDSDPYMSALKDAGKGLNLAFTGWEEDVGEAMQQLDLVAVPSRSYDAAPRVIPEAFSAGIPVLATPSGGIPELIQDNQTGFLTAGATPALIAERLREVMRSTDGRLRTIGANARQRWDERFTLSRYRQEIWDGLVSAVKE